MGIGFCSASKSKVFYPSEQTTECCLKNFRAHKLLGHKTERDRERELTKSQEMGVTKEQVESTLKSKLNPSHLEVVDTSGGCGASFAIEIVSEQFEGKRLLERHRLVNAALVEEMKEIHALSIKKAVTPAQWKQQQETQQSTSAA